MIASGKQIKALKFLQRFFNFSSRLKMSFFHSFSERRKGSQELMVPSSHFWLFSVTKINSRITDVFFSPVTKILDILKKTQTKLLRYRKCVPFSSVLIVILILAFNCFQRLEMLSQLNWFKYHFSIVQYRNLHQWLCFFLKNIQFHKFDGKVLHCIKQFCSYLENIFTLRQTGLMMLHRTEY